MDTQTTNPSNRDLASVLAGLVDEGVLTADQAEAVRAAVARPSDRRRRGISAVAEALAYAGAAVAGSAALALASLWWDRLLAPSQAGVLVLAAAALLTAGFWVDGEDATGPVRRLVAFCWFFSIAALTGAVAVSAGEWLLLPDGEALLAVGVAATAMSGLLGRRRPSPLLLVALFLGVQAVAFGLVEVAVAPEYYDLGGLLVWAVSVGFAALTWAGLLAPHRAGYVLACTGALLGAQLLRFDSDGLGIGLGLVTAAAMLTTMRAGERAVAGFGAAGLVVFVPQALSEVFPGAVAAPVALFTIGLAVLGVALAQVRSGGDRS
jgi:hypothetical protein